MNHKTIMEFHGGLDTIGGNIISLVYNGYRIITDFGAVVGVDINELAYQRNTQALYDDNKLPKIDGLFRQEALEGNSTLSYEASDLKTIVLISHLHWTMWGAWLIYIRKFLSMQPRQRLLYIIR